MSDTKGGAKRVACTAPNCKNAGFSGQTVPVPDPGKPRVTISVPLILTLPGLVGDAAVEAARCYWHKRDGDVPFPGATASQTARPANDRRFQATPPTRPANPSRPQVSGARPASPTPSRSEGGRPGSAPRPTTAPRAARPEAPPTRPANPSRPQVSAPRAARPEAPLRISSEPIAPPPARPVGSKVVGGDMPRTTLGDLGLTPEVWAMVQAERAKKAPPSPPPITEVVETKVPEPVAVDAVPSGPIVIYRQRKPAVEMLAEIREEMGEENGVWFYRRNSPFVPALKRDLSIDVGETPEPTLVRKIEMKFGKPWLVERRGGVVVDRLGMFQAFDELGCPVWGYRDAKEDAYFMRLPDGGFGACTRKKFGGFDGTVFLLAFIRVVPETPLDEDVMDVTPSSVTTHEVETQPEA